MDRDEIRRQVKARIMEVMRVAEAQGLDGYKAAERAFPGTPDMVLIECGVELDCAAVDAWWEAVEKTIDVELAQRAIAAAGEGT